jgi:hypothetical protein
LPAVLLGNVHFRNVQAFAVTTKTAYANADDVFDVYLDYGDSKIYLVPTARTRRLMRKKSPLECGPTKR